jgi:DNA-binding MarR family transcriptional regulator
VPRLVSAEGLAAWRAFLDAHAAVIGRIEADMERHRLVSLVWYDVLVAISEAPDRQLRPRDLARRLVLTRSGATRLVDRLEQAGLVRREPTEDDRRGAAVVLTTAGTRALRRAWPVYAAGINTLFVDVLTPDEARVLRDAMTRVAAAPRQSEPPS